MRVKNINGTSPRACACGSWLNHWRKDSGASGRYCSVVACPNLADVGGHVRPIVSPDAERFIVPLCGEHNGEWGEELLIGGTRALVPAVASERCGPF